jgi:hypothetical protein
MNKESVRVITNLERVGISFDDAMALRRCAMTLHRWFEAECGDSNSHASWAIERDDNGDGPPFMVTHHYGHALRGSLRHSADRTTRTRIPDREAGARKRIGKIMAKYPGFSAYVQGDPRGAPLYILRPGDVPEGSKADECYNRGVAVYK